MMRKLGEGAIWILLIGFFSSAPVGAQVKFNDVPADHWAAKSVYDLVRLGITQGYPDGTFRGKKNITRYETAIFLSKLAEKLGGGSAAQVKSDLESIKNEITKMRRDEGAEITGSYELVGRVANVLAAGGVTGRGPLMNYRLKTTLGKDLGQGSSVKVNFDTMDAGFYGATRELTSQMIDVQGMLKVNPVDIGLSDLGAPIDITLSMGPGPIRHTDSTHVLPSENGLVYDRPYSGIGIATQLFGIDVSGSYLQIAKTSSGQSTTSLVKGIIKYYFNRISMEVVGDYYFKHVVGVRDLRSTINFDTMITSKLQVKGSIGIGGGGLNSWLVKVEPSIMDPWNTGTTLKLRGSKVGSEFITSDFSNEEFNLAGYDLFLRPLEAATANLESELVQAFSGKLAFVGRAALRLSGDFGYGRDKPKSRATGQAGLMYEIAPSSILNVYYRIEQNPVVGETTDLAAVGFTYKF